MKSIPVSKPSFGEVESAYLNQALITGRITMGAMVELFEDMLQKHFGYEVHVVTCSSGTAALHLALEAHHFTPECEVLVPDLTYIASANAVTYTGARVVLVDVDRETWTIDIEDCKRKISNNTVAIMPVHLYGMPCDMNAVLDFADEHDLIIVEDAAEALGAKFENIPCGMFGHAGCFSFYGNKIITTAEGGCVVTADERLADEMRLLRGQGQSAHRKFYHEVIGFNYRMSDLHAAIGVAQLSQLPKFLEQREEIFKRYDSLLNLQMQRAPSPIFDVAPWLYTVVLPTQDQRDHVAAHLAAQQIETRPVFVPIHRQPMYEQPDEDFPVSSDIADRGLSLPTYPSMSREDIDWVATSVNACFGAQLRVVKS